MTVALTYQLIVDGLQSIGGPARAPDIYEQIVKLFPGEALGKTPVATIRARLQENCPESSQYKGLRQLFYRVTPVEVREGVWWLREAVQPLLDEAQVLLSVEGRQMLREHLVRERSAKIVQSFKSALRVFECSVCNFNFEKVYGSIGHGFIEAHHVVPLSQSGQTVTRLEDLVPVCSNCHRMLHREFNLTCEDLRKKIRTKLANSVEK